MLMLPGLCLFVFLQSLLRGLRYRFSLGCRHRFLRLLLCCERGLRYSSCGFPLGHGGGSSSGSCLFRLLCGLAPAPSSSAAAASSSSSSSLLLLTSPPPLWRRRHWRRASSGAGLETEVEEVHVHVNPTSHFCSCKGSAYRRHSRRRLRCRLFPSSQRAPRQRS